MKDAKVSAPQTELEQLVSDPRWGTFWMLRPIFNLCRKGAKKSPPRWQVWDCTELWYPGKRNPNDLIVVDAPTPEEAVRLALKSFRGTP